MTIFYNPEKNIRANERILHINHGLTPLTCGSFGWVELDITHPEFDSDLYFLLDNGTEKTVDGWGVKWESVPKDISSIKTSLNHRIKMMRKHKLNEERCYRGINCKTTIENISNFISFYNTKILSTTFLTSLFFSTPLNSNNASFLLPLFSFK